jgi:hypothetical protein
MISIIQHNCCLRKIYGFPFEVINVGRKHCNQPLIISDAGLGAMSKEGKSLLSVVWWRVEFYLWQYIMKTSQQYNLRETTNDLPQD